MLKEIGEERDERPKHEQMHEYEEQRQREELRNETTGYDEL